MKITRDSAFLVYGFRLVFFLSEVHADRKIASIVIKIYYQYFSPIRLLFAKAINPNRSFPGFVQGIRILPFMISQRNRVTVSVIMGLNGI